MAGNTAEAAIARFGPRFGQGGQDAVAGHTAKAATDRCGPRFGRGGQTAVAGHTAKAAMARFWPRCGHEAGDDACYVGRTEISFQPGVDFNEFPTSQRDLSAWLEDYTLDQLWSMGRIEGRG